jgi:hypothetical protein
MSKYQKNFPIFSSHIDLAHRFWEQLLQPGDHAIDSTCGNGKDSLKLAQLILKNDAGFLLGMDIQQEALNTTQNLLKRHLEPSLLQNVRLVLQSHDTFPEIVYSKEIKLIVYNLGYLPGGNKSLTTQLETTIKSLQQALSLICKGGAISVTCYPGHPEGARELAELLSFAALLPCTEWTVSSHRTLNRTLSPELLLFQRRIHI